MYKIPYNHLKTLKANRNLMFFMVQKSRVQMALVAGLLDSLGYLLEKSRKLGKTENK